MPMATVSPEGSTLLPHHALQGGGMHARNVISNAVSS